MNFYWWRDYGSPAEGYLATVVYILGVVILTCFLIHFTSNIFYHKRLMISRQNKLFIGSILGLQTFSLLFAIHVLVSHCINTFTLWHWNCWMQNTNIPTLAISRMFLYGFFISRLHILLTGTEYAFSTKFITFATYLMIILTTFCGIIGYYIIIVYDCHFLGFVFGAGFGAINDAFWSITITTSIYKKYKLVIANSATSGMKMTKYKSWKQNNSNYNSNYNSDNDNQNQNQNQDSGSGTNGTNTHSTQFQSVENNPGHNKIVATEPIAGVYLNIAQDRPRNMSNHSTQQTTQQQKEQSNVTINGSTIVGKTKNKDLPVINALASQSDESTTKSNSTKTDHEGGDDDADNGARDEISYVSQSPETLTVATAIENEDQSTVKQTIHNKQSNPYQEAKKKDDNSGITGGNNEVSQDNTHINSKSNKNNPFDFYEQLFNQRDKKLIDLNMKFFILSLSAMLTSWMTYISFIYLDAGIGVIIDSVINNGLLLIAFSFNQTKYDFCCFFCVKYCKQTWIKHFLDGIHQLDL